MDKHKEKQRQSCVQRAVQHIRRNRCGTASLLLLAVGAVILLLVQSGGVSWLTDAPISQPGRVLLVTAHPDDEVIFFSSSVTALHAAGAEVFLLCLTSGDAHGLGQQRVLELEKAAQALGIDRDHLTILNDTRIQDGHHEIWEQEYVAGIVAAEVDVRDINTIITFDPMGVTGHINHEGCYTGVRYYLTVCRRQGVDCPAGWSLTTTEELRTYSSLLDILPSALESKGSEDAAMYTNHDLYGMFRAMSAHKSQSRWWKHVLVTRYTFVNTLRRITPLVFDWTMPLPMPDLARKLPSSQVPGQAPRPAANPQLESNVHLRHEEVSEAADRRGKFMARLSRRIIKSRTHL
ncbi:g13553 [Coccomyxa viridis]|uniref:N-acetylglucosaminylphosphatidylinositol deacetylase n=1 Tax=Coccomyxa viridis TaxID=1274662 RepID=A0ABP1GFN1_9CHLO